MRGRLALFFLIGKCSHADLARNCAASASRIIHFREKHATPFIAKLHRPPGNKQIGEAPGIIEMYMTEEQWRSLLKRDR